MYHIVELKLLDSYKMSTIVYILENISLDLDAVSCTLRKLYFYFLSQWMGYDRGDGFWTKWKYHLVQKLSPRSYPIHCGRKWKYSFLSVWTVDIAEKVKKSVAVLPTAESIPISRYSKGVNKQRDYKHAGNCQLQVRASFIGLQFITCWLHGCIMYVYIYIYFLFYSRGI